MTSQTCTQGVFNILLTAVGVGVLSLPKAIALSGWIAGFALLFIFGGLSVYLCILLDRCMHLAEVKGAVISKYEHIGYAAFGQVGRLAALVPLHLSLIGCCSALMMLLASNTRVLVSSVSQTTLVWLWGIVLLPMVWMPTMKHVGYVSSTLGVASILVMVVSVVIGGFYQMKRADVSYSALPTGLGGFGSSFAAMTFAFAVTCTIPTIIRDLEKRSEAPRVIVWGLTLTLAVYFVVALSGYLGWGSNATQAIHELLPADGWYSTSCRVSLIIACACHYAVMLHPTCREVEEALGVKNNYCLRTLSRTALAALTFLIASRVDKLDTYVGILGSVTFAIIHSFLPPLFYMRLSRVQGKPLCLLETAWLSCLMILTVIGGTFGVLDSFKLL